MIVMKMKKVSYQKSFSRNIAGEASILLISTGISIQALWPIAFWKINPSAGYRNDPSKHRYESS